MSEEDDKDFYRARFKQQNLKRAKFGEEELPLPEELMGEGDSDYNLELSERNESRERESEKDEDNIIYDKKGRRVFDEDGLSIDYGD